MRSLLRLLMVYTLLCSICASGMGETLAFGGRGEDVLYEAAACDNGFFAVGKTASVDGDLASRKRTGETGWALRVDRDGKRLWDFCTAKSGMYEMIAPYAYADGRFSLILTDETRQRGEWIVLTDRGRQESRVVIAKGAHIVQMTPALCSTGPCLMLLEERDAMLCASLLTQDGGVYGCGTFFADAQGVLRAVPQGGALYLSADLGALLIVSMTPGNAPKMQTVALEKTDAVISGVTDALVGSDASVLAAVRTVAAGKPSGMMLLRVSAEGEILFSHAFGEGEEIAHLTQTETGYAAACGDSVLFFDEDGAVLGKAQMQAQPIDIFPSEGSVYMLSHNPERGQRQAVFTPLAMEEAEQEAAQEENVQDEADAPEFSEREMTGNPSGLQAEGRLTLAKGYLLCTDDGLRGVTVARVDEQGDVLWQTRTPIHTAADRLVWDTAQITEEGDILLSGCYETQTAQGVLRDGARAVLSADGVLREIGLTE